MDSGRPSSRADARLGRLERILGAALALAVGAQTYGVICSALRCSDSGVGLPFLFIASMAGLLAVGLYLKLVEDWRFQWPLRLAASGVALLLFIVLLVLPVHRSGQHLVERQAVQQQERVLTEFHQQKADAAWQAALLASGANGPPGTVPPGLRVEPGGAGVVVTNTTSRQLIIALARVREDAKAPGGWRACAMHTDGSSRGTLRFHSYGLNAGESATFVGFAPCADAFRDAPIEYRVGRRPDDTGWWSDSAFTAPAGREHADGR